MLPIGTPTRRQAIFSTAVAVLLASVVLLPLLGHKALAEWDEGIYAEVSREMLDGSWLVPHWNGQPWFEKPPLMLWITAIFFKFFGVTEFWARAGSAFSGVAMVALLHGWMARRRDLLTAWLSSVILLATLGFLHVCHVGELDVLLALGTCVALIGMSEISGAGPSARGWMLFWIGFAIAVMTKGAASVVLPITAFFLSMLQRWGWKRFGSGFWLGLLLFTLLVAPWHLDMYRHFGHGFVDEYLGLHVLTRATRQIEGHRTHWWFYLKVLLVSAPPFCLLYPVAIVRGYRRPEFCVWAIYTVVAVLFFTMIQTRLPHYIAPVYPVLAVLTAAWVGEWIRDHATQGKPFWIRVAAASAAIWIASILLTHSALKNLHRARLGDGTTLADNKEADALLRAAHVAESTDDGPLLMWCDARVQSIATVIFYAQRPVQQVELTPHGHAIARDRYMFNPKPMDEAVDWQPRLILLDKSLIPVIPHAFVFTPVRSSATLALGTISRAPR